MKEADVEYYKTLTRALTTAAAAAQTLACDCKSSSHGQCSDAVKTERTLADALERLGTILQWQAR